MGVALALALALVIVGIGFFPFCRCCFCFCGAFSIRIEELEDSFEMGAKSLYLTALLEL